MISYKGKLGVLVALPVLASIFGVIDLAALQGELAGLLTLQGAFTPPSLTGVLNFAIALNAAASAGFQPPSLNLLAVLDAKIGLLLGKIKLIGDLTLLLTGGSVRVYEYNGRADAFGPELTATLAGPDVDGGIQPAQQTTALILVAEAGSAGATALSTLRGEVLCPARFSPTYLPG